MRVNVVQRHSELGMVGLHYASVEELLSTS